MNTSEKFLVCSALLIAGVALGMYLEHERFLREIQGLSKQHANEPATAPKEETAA
jgi:hypothetical protein